MKPGHVVSLIEAAYRVDSSTEKWLEQIAEAGSAALESSHGAMAFRYDSSSGEWTHVSAASFHGLPASFPQAFFGRPDTRPEAANALASVFKSVRVGSIREVIGGLGLTATFGAILDHHGIDDMTAVNGMDPSGHGCALFVASQRSRLSPRAQHVLHRLAAHVSAGNRLRATLEGIAKQGADGTQHAEAILAPNGNVEHATGAAEPRSAREALREALVRIDAARTERDDACRSVDLWRGLVAGRWSLVEHFESDGRRYFLAHKNDPELKEDRALTLRERQVLGYAELGNSNKVTAYSLGISSSTVSTLLARARKKIGMTP